MPAATNRNDLRAVTAKEYGKLSGLIATITAEQANRPHDGSTIKDVIAHRAHWTELFFGWYADGQSGRPVYFPARGYNWAEMKRYNADLRDSQADLNWPDAQAMLHGSYKKLITFIESHSDVDLYAGPMKGAKNTWTTGRWAEAAGASHYRSATKYIRAALRAQA